MGAAYVPTLKLISEDEASDEVRLIYNEIKDFFNLDFVPEMFRVIAHDPSRLRHTWETIRSLYQGKLGVDPMLYESVGLAVAIARSCPYCINWHTTFLKALGKSDAEIENLVNVISLANMFISYTIGVQNTPDVVPEHAGRISRSKALREREVLVKPSM